MGDVELAHGFDHPLRGRAGFGRGDAGDEERELLAALAREEAARALDFAAQRARHLLEAVVARDVAVAVVVAFEEVDIEDADGQARAGAQRLLAFVTQPLVETPAVGDAGEAVDRGEFAQPVRLRLQEQLGADADLSECLAYTQQRVCLDEKRKNCKPPGCSIKDIDDSFDETTKRMNDYCSKVGIK